MSLALYQPLFRGRRLGMRWFIDPHPLVMSQDSVGAPASLTATAIPQAIVLTWPTALGAITYNVYRGTSTGTETLYATNVSGNSYADTGVSASTTYFYKVTGVNGGIESAKSTEASASSLVFDNLLSAYTGTWQDSAMTLPAVNANDPVGGWADSVGGATWTQSNNSNRMFLTFVNGKQRVRSGGGTAQGMTTTLAPTGNVTLMLVGSPWENIGGGCRDLDSGSINALMTLSQRADNLAVFVVAGVATRSSFDLNQHVLMATRNGSLWTAYLDGISIGSLTPDNNNFGALCIGGSGSNGEASRSNIAYIGVAHRVMSAGEIAAAAAWGVTA